MKKYLIVVEQTPSGFSSYSPDLDGCVATGKSLEEVESNMRDAVAFHLEGLHREGCQIPEPHSRAAYIEVQP
jgi:predicted RNase H-like HicB family nuclease